MSKEKWKDIPGFESCYQASTFGRIRSKKRVVVYSNGAVYKYPSKVLVPGITPSGYYTLTLCKDTLRYSRRVCRLIAKTFIKNPFNKLQVNHKDGDKLNDSVKNLEWATASENQIHRYSVLKKGVPTGEQHANSKMNNKKVKELRILYASGKYSQRELANKYGITQPTANEIISKKLWSHI